MEKEEKDYSFGKSHKLCGDKPLEELFAKGKGFIKFPLRVVYLVVDRREGEYPCRMMVSVGKKRFKRAVKRNRMKRLVREAFRLHRHPLEDAVKALGPAKALHIAYVFVGKEMPDYMTTETAVSQSIVKMSQTLAKLAENGHS